MFAVVYEDRRMGVPRYKNGGSPFVFFQNTHNLITTNEQEIFYEIKLKIYQL